MLGLGMVLGQMLSGPRQLILSYCPSAIRGCPDVWNPDARTAAGSLEQKTWQQQPSLNLRVSCELRQMHRTQPQMSLYQDPAFASSLPPSLLLWSYHLVLKTWRKRREKQEKSGALVRPFWVGGVTPCPEERGGSRVFSGRRGGGGDRLPVQHIRPGFKFPIPLGDDILEGGGPCGGTTGWGTKQEEGVPPPMRPASSLPVFLRCKSVSPVRVLKELVLILHGNQRLTHLNLSSNNLGIPVSTMIFKTLRHSACNLQYLW